MKRATKWGLAAAAVVAGALIARCDAGDPDPGDEAPARTEACEVDLTPYLGAGGAGAAARRIASEQDLLGGPSAWGRVGDYLLENDRIRVVVQAPDRHLQPNPFGGQIIDADLKRAGPGRDSFGKIGVLYNFGRTQEATAVTVLRDGSDGGPAVLAADGHDALNDFINVSNLLSGQIPGVRLAFDVDAALPLTITNYYVLNPGESRVRIVTAFCNGGRKALSLPVGDLIDSGGPVEFFQPGSCTGGFGFEGSTECMASDMSWYGFQGEGVAYGYAPRMPRAPEQLSTQNAALVVSGVVGTLLGIGDKSAFQVLLGYTNPDSVNRAEELRISGGKSAVLVRDLFVGRDLAEVSSLIAAQGPEAGSLARVSGKVQAGGAPAAGARVAFERDVQSADGSSRRVVETVAVADDAGAFAAALPPGDWQASAWMAGSRPTAPKALTLAAGGERTEQLELEAPRFLTVRIRDAEGGPMPGKITLLCEQHPCDPAWSKLVRWADVGRDKLPDNVALMEFVGPSGEGRFAVPAGRYRAVVTRGPEWSAWPVSWKPSSTTDASTGHLVDLSEEDQTLDATLAHVVDSAGWVSADFHVHAINSPDAYVPNAARLVSFMGEGVDVLVATDHDYVTDFAPLNASLGGQPFLSTVPAQEITTFDYGHTNAFPLRHDPADLTGGAIDWAGGTGPGLSWPEIFLAARAKGATTVHVNHARSGLGVFSNLRVDTDSGATRADPAPFRIAPQAGATAADTRLVSLDFNALEVFNGGGDRLDCCSGRALLNDWFTFLSRGRRIAATGVSDSHKRFADGPGYWRSYVRTGEDSPARFDASALSQSVNALKVIASNGPFVTLRAAALDSQGKPNGPETEIGGTLSAKGSRFALTVDVQTPGWLRVRRIELVTHVPGGDVPCSESSDPAANPRSRVACDGKSNGNWPAEGIAAAADLTEAEVSLETAVSRDGVDYQRARVTRRFELDAPAADTWFVALVYGKGTMFPLVYSGVDASSHKPGNTVPMAVTNPVFVDADGGGYDHFPAGGLAEKRLDRKGQRPAPAAEPPRRPATAEELEALLRSLLAH